MHFNVFYLSVDESQDDEGKEETTATESNGNSNDYFADAETSCGSFEHDDVFTSNSEGKDAAEKGLVARLFICLTVTVVFHQSLIVSFGRSFSWSSLGGGWDWERIYGGSK